MRVIGWVFGVILVFYLLVYSSKDKIRDWFFPNIVKVITYEEAQLNTVQIDWTSEDSEDTVRIFNNGIQTDEEFRARGFNEFYVRMAGNYISTFEQFKTSSSSGHQYTFHIWQRGDSVRLDLQIVGPEAPM